MKEPITIYRFQDAPKQLQALNTNGGDEDWLAIIPTHFKNQWIGWLKEGSSFGPCRVQTHDHPEPPRTKQKKGYQVRIGCHS